MKRLFSSAGILLLIMLNLIAVKPAVVWAAPTPQLEQPTAPVDSSKAPIDVVILLDDPGSMATCWPWPQDRAPFNPPCGAPSPNAPSDPAELRYSAARLLLQLADAEDRVAVVRFDSEGQVQEIIEKPEVPPSNYAVTGLYFLDGDAPKLARQVTPSARGELEITTLLEMYLKAGKLTVKRMGRGYAWLDTGTHGSLLDAGNFVRTLEKRQGLQTGCLDEIAHDLGWISNADLRARAEMFAKNDYGRYLKRLLD